MVHISQKLSSSCHALQGSTLGKAKKRPENKGRYCYSQSIDVVSLVGRVRKKSGIDSE